MNTADRLALGFTLSEDDDRVFGIDRVPPEITYVLQPRPGAVCQQNCALPIAFGDLYEPGDLFSAKGVFDCRVIRQWIGRRDRIIADLAELPRLLEGP